MYQIGDLVIYSTHGICRIDDITTIKIAGEDREYYVLHPIDNKQQLTINAPVQTDDVIIQRLINKEEAFQIIESFSEKGIAWEENANVRYNSYNKIVRDGERKEIAKVINTLMRKRIELESVDKKLHQKDERLLEHVQDILWKELAIALDTSIEDIEMWIMQRINEKKVLS